MPCSMHTFCRLLCLSIAIASLISCDKKLLEPSTSTQKDVSNFVTPLTVAQGQQYYKSVLIKKSINTPKHLYSQSLGEVTADFSHAVQQESGSFYSIEVPITSSKSTAYAISNQSKTTLEAAKKLLNTNFNRLVIYKNKQNGSIGERIVNFVPDANNTENDIRDINLNRTGGLSKKFSGWLVYQTWSGNSLFALHIDKGRPTNKFNFSSLEKKDGKSSKSSRNGSVNDCETIFWEKFVQMCYTQVPNNGSEVCIWEPTGDTWLEVVCEEDPNDPDLDPACYQLGNCSEPYSPGTVTGPISSTPSDLTNQQQLDNLLQTDPVYAAYYATLTPAEKLWALLVPIAAYKGYQNATQSLQMANSTFPGNQHNSAADALRHALWNGMNTNDMGLYLAQEFGDAHEDFPTNDPLEKRMDLFNNEQGRLAALKLQEDNEYTLANLSDYLIFLAENGGLRVIHNGQLVPSP
jgi:hypothetical protein